MPDAAGPTIVIAGTREDWPGGPRTLTPRDPTREPNRRILWFGAELDPDGSQQVWFRITAEAVGRMREEDAARQRRPPHRHPPRLADAGPSAASTARSRATGSKRRPPTTTPATAATDPRSSPNPNPEPRSGTCRSSTPTTLSWPNYRRPPRPASPRSSSRPSSRSRATEGGTDDDPWNPRTRGEGRGRAVRGDLAQRLRLAAARWFLAFPDRRAPPVCRPSTRLGATSCPSRWPTPGPPNSSRGVCAVDLDTLDVELPRGFGRD